MMAIFEMDDDIYNVDILSFQREFRFPQSQQAVTTMDGQYHWDCLRTEDVFRVVFRPRPGYEQEMDLLYNRLRRKNIHDCVFPYGLTQVNLPVYVVGCRQKLVNTRGETRWGQLEVEFHTQQEVSQWN